MEDDRPTAGRADQEENEEDALPDWRQFAKFAKSLKTKDEHTPFIPKRGEKDFEPIPFSSSLSQSSKEATLSQYQLNTLNESRSALFTALSSGSRFHSSRGYNSFTWRPTVEGGRASCDAGTAAYGVHFANLGRYSAERKRLELLPEEALYMVERGAIELWREAEERGDDAVKVPMTVQQAWAEIIGHDELTLERFQVFAHLKRLGYVLTRARATPAPSGKTVKPALPRRSLLALLALPFSALRHLVFQLVSSLRRIPLLLKSSGPLLPLTRLLRRSEGVSRPLAFGRRWATYDQIFGRLQVIPSGHDAPLPRSAIPHSPNVLAPLIPAIDSSSTTPGLPDLEQHPYQIFYHIYKPVTKFRKTAPPPPDFRLVIINANTTPLPDLFEFSALFDSLPFSPENTLLPPPPVARVGLPPPTPRFRPRAPLPPPTFLQRINSFLPGAGRKTFKPSPYPRLKTGRRSVLVAVVDNGTTSFLRFSEAEFAKMPWKGTARGL